MNPYLLGGAFVVGAGAVSVAGGNALLFLKTKYDILSKYSEGGKEAVEKYISESVDNYSFYLKIGPKLAVRKYRKGKLGIEPSLPSPIV